MKYSIKRFFLVFVFLFPSFFVFKSVFAQDTVLLDFNRAYQDFVFTYDKYRTAHSEYELARAQYIQSQTLTSQSKAQEATAKMLEARDDVVRSHLTALRFRVFEQEGMSQSTKEVLFGKIDLEVTWFEAHKNNLSSASSLPDLVSDSDEAKAHYQSITEGLIYEVLSEVSIAKTSSLRETQNSILSEINIKVSEIRTNNDLDVSSIERWVLETQGRSLRSSEKETEAVKLLSQFSVAKANKPAAYNQIITKLSESVQYLKDANTFLKEIINKIKKG